MAVPTKGTSVTEFKLQASIKDADGDMVNFRAESPVELSAHLQNFPYAEYAEAKAALRGAGAASAITQPAQGHPVQQHPSNPQPTQAQQGGWGSAPVVSTATGAPVVHQQQVPQQQAQQRQYGGPPHPEGKQCNACGNVLEFGKTKSGKGQWKCSQYRWNSGNPNEHTLEWAN